MAFDVVAASERVNRMWLALARKFEARINSEMDKANYATALRVAKCAEACFWKATGEDPCFGVQDVIGSATTSDVGHRT